MNTINLIDDKNVIRLTFLNREFPDSTDWYDSNWLSTSIQTESVNKNIKIMTSILTFELDSLRNNLLKIINDEITSFIFEPMEPELRIYLIKQSRECSQVEVDILPDTTKKESAIKYQLLIKNDNLNKIVQEIEYILEVYPIKNIKGK